MNSAADAVSPQGTQLLAPRLPAGRGAIAEVGEIDRDTLDPKPL
jgi:hypothetical protein